MSALTLTSKAKPVFLSQNRFNRHADLEGDLACSTGNDLRHRLYGMDPAAYWASIGSNDATRETIESGLWDSGVQGLYDIDFIGILGHNLKAFTIEFSANNGVTWPYSYAYADQTAANTLRSLPAAIAVNRWRLLMDTTQTANAEKNVGTVVIALAQFQSPVGLSTYRKHPPRVKAKTATMHDGSLRRSYVYRSDASVGFYSASLGFTGVSDAELADFRAALLTHEPFCFVPEPGDRQGEIFQCAAVPGTYTENYITLSRSGGNVVTVDLEEVGGA